MADRMGRDNDPIIVVGGGAWGAAVADALRERGDVDIELWERDAPAAGASGRAAGILSSQLRTRLDIRLSLRTRTALRALLEWAEEAAPKEKEAVAAVTLDGITLAGSERATALEVVAGRMRQEGLDARIGAAEAIVDAGEGLVRLGGLSALRSSGEMVVDAGAAVRLILARFASRGGRLRVGRGASRILTDDGQVTGVEDDAGRRHAASRVVVAAGCWSAPLLAPLGLRLPLRPYRTQLALIAPRETPPRLVVHDADLGFYFRPDGSAILAGDGTTEVEEDPDAYAETGDRTFKERMQEGLSRRLGREVGSLPVRKAWAGLCGATPDRWPLLGPVDQVQGLHLMVGDNGYGFMRSMALAQWVAAGVWDGRLPAGAAAMDATRFDLTSEAAFEIRQGFELSDRASNQTVA